MKTRRLLFALCSLALLWSCEPNHPDSYLVNHPPEVLAQTFAVAEDLPGGTPIGKLKATDKDGDALVFSLSDDQSGFFSLTKGGTLSLSEGKSLDYVKYPEHQLKIYVNDGTVGRPGNVTLKIVPADPENLPPTMKAQVFVASEDILDSEVIGTVEADDPDDNDLAFAIVEDSDGLFELTEAGGLSLMEGKTLDFETQTEHLLTVSVSDGSGFAQAVVKVQVGNVDEPPTASDQGFETNEGIVDTDIIGTVTASDPEGDALTFAIVEDVDALFEITGAGELSLAEGKALDFETQTEHQLTISVSDGTNEPVPFVVTATVNNVIENLFEDPASFILRFQVTDGQQLTIGTNPNYNYDFTIDWGDGTGEEQVTQQNPSHLYTTGDTYSVAIKGSFPALRMGFADQASRNALVDVSQWGSNIWQSMASTFAGCQNLTGFTATDTPDLSEVTIMVAMFQNATSFNGDIGDWDTSNVSSMAIMLFGATSFNRDISQWNTENVTNMEGMFYYANTFNQDIGNWSTMNVTNMVQMFMGATSFNQDIGQWKTGNVTNMRDMFREATSFNQDIGLWDVGKVTIIGNMFYGATSFDQDLGGWDISSITGPFGMFDMFRNSGISSANYSATLQGWAALGNENIPDGLNLGTTFIPLCSNNETISARNILVVDNGWTIIEWGYVNCP